ncbi:MAG: ribose-phosphate pyrophosphokinase [Candidatus Eisenbacteria bacterium]|uniref:Ribose-phosphate pyrophosphokinase n=1 Tax=Eiseniibacteriota bacterium TaxID=2212470 RepID=A0A956NC66_UNCEI|nr:ribose-phosphate pyrophosphokinase [Candidatus Eisenbacteria bacterium]MCB9463289.1 ribose-phosphate pyrophosphokinase [Candidatus Eisenbacteria bacterium]
MATRKKHPDRPIKTTHPLRLFTGSANPALAQEVAKALGAPLGKCTTTRLPDSEIHVIVDEPVRDDDVFIIQSCSAPVNDHLMELLLYVDAFRRASAHSITVVVPYFPYARQERMARGREAISAKVVATTMESLGVDRVLFMDIHAPAIQGFFNIPVDPLTAVHVLSAPFKRRKKLLKQAVVVAPDEGRVKLAGKYAQALDVPLVLMHKRRMDFRETKTTHVVGDIEGKIPIVIDDIIAGGSVLDQVGALLQAGAVPEIHLAITHGILTESAMSRLDRPEIAELLVTNTVPAGPARRHPKVKVCSIAQVLADAIDRIHCGTSIGDLLGR